MRMSLSAAQNILDCFDGALNRSLVVNARGGFLRAECRRRLVHDQNACIEMYGARNGN